MSNDIFDYFSGHSAKKVEPVEDELNDELEDEEATDFAEAAIADGEFATEQNTSKAVSISDDDDEGVAAETQETGSKESVPKLSHWDRLLGKLGISAPTAPPPPPQSRELPQKKKTKAKATSKLKDKKPKSKPDEPFGGLLAPESEWRATKQPEKIDDKEAIDASQIEQDEIPQIKDDAASQPEPKSSFAFGLFEQPENSASADVDEVESPLTEMFVPSDDFEEPFDEGIAEKVIDDLPDIVEIEDFADEQLQAFDVDEDFVEFEVKDLDFSDDIDEPPRRPSRRSNARRDRQGGEARGRAREDEGERTERGRSRERSGRDKSETDREPRPSRSRSARSRRPDSEDIPVSEDAQLDADFIAEEIGEVEESEKREPRRRRGSRGRGRSRRESRPRSDQPGWDDEIAEPLDRDDLQNDDPESEDRDSRSHRERVPQGGRRVDRPETSDESDFDDDFEEREFDDDFQESEAEQTESRSRKRRGVEREAAPVSQVAKTGDGEDESKMKRPHIPTWDEAITGMIESNIKSRGKSNSGGRRPRRPRRK